MRRMRKDALPEGTRLAKAEVVERLVEPAEAAIGDARPTGRRGHGRLL